jgi:hypothetical protein
MKMKIVQFIQLKSLSAFFLLTLVSLPSFAQSRFEIGAMGGTNFYLGELNTKLFNAFEPAYGGFFRVNINPRFAVKTQFVAASLQQQTELNYVDISSHIEFHFYDYGLPSYSQRKKHVISPYIFTGLGICAYSDMFNGTNFEPSLPFGVGIKVKIGNKLNMGLEWSMHKLFTDKFDNVDNPYQLESNIFYNNDWYSLATVFLSFDLGDTKFKCR